MSQPSVASFFNTRKRPANDDVATTKHRLITSTDSSTESKSFALEQDNAGVLEKQNSSSRVLRRIGVQRRGSSTDAVPEKIAKIEVKQQKLVQFIKKGPLSPCKSKRLRQNAIEQSVNEQTPDTMHIMNKAFAPKNNALNMERGMKTPTKQIIKNLKGTPLKADELKNLVKKELNFEEVKSKVTRSAKLLELKASLARMQELEKTRKAQEERNRLIAEGSTLRSPEKESVVQLKEFDTVEFEVLTSPAKSLKTPTKLPPPTPDKNELMSPRHTAVSKRILFSPAKQPGSPAKLITPPAYQRFLNLAEPTKSSLLPLPYKYRQLIEIFKGVDSVCAMLHNRKECITFKKLKPAVQRILRKNFTETHLAQIKHVKPEAFIFTQMKMRNYGSVSKADYFQLVITPNVDGSSASSKPSPIDEDNVYNAALSNAMNPHVLTERLLIFQNLLLQRVKDEHDKFLKSLDPPLILAKDKITRWHPDFDLENCADIECSHLPQPPNVEKYASAREILSTARNLFNCATPMERALERFEAKIEADRKLLDTGHSDKAVEQQVGKKEDCSVNDNITDTKPTIAITNKEINTTLLKGVPTSLLEKIRAKQAAKALDAMTRRPSQDQEAINYSRLPQLARHLRNVFITERRSVLALDVVIKKIQNSFRTYLTLQEIESHLKLIAKEVPSWIAFHEVRKTMYLKMAKDSDLSKIIAQLEIVANEKTK